MPRKQKACCLALFLIFASQTQAAVAGSYLDPYKHIMVPSQGGYPDEPASICFPSYERPTVKKQNFIKRLCRKISQRMHAEPAGT